MKQLKLILENLNLGENSTLSAVQWFDVFLGQSMKWSEGEKGSQLEGKQLGKLRTPSGSLPLLLINGTPLVLFLDL